MFNVLSSLHCSEVRMAFEKKKQSTRDSDKKSPENSRTSQVVEATTIQQLSSERNMDQFLQAASDTENS